ncbi:hypothetical protein PVAP13_5NG170862 [Panicum virgatum]|uniref:Uncharacterized protein n=1 Tax=Panicum virgatum TaxID=38727 RepID=A0A8T0RQZ5_PANVG|nr:hypothetical protein PVAP13_5NG170862 [Panicum virgatum]
MKRLTFDIISSLLFGLERGAVRDALAADFMHLLDGVWAVPVDLPFTAFRRSLRASARSRRVIAGIAQETKAKLERGEASRSSDLIACLLSLTDDSGARQLSEEEVVDCSMGTLIGGHETSAILMTFMVRHLANDPDTLAAMVQEHDEITKNKGNGEALVWDDLAKMKFTWRVAQETLRLVPPAFGLFRRAIGDTEFDGYLIPKGWQVFLAASATHMDAAIFHEPAKFDASRFKDQPSATAPPCSFVAFGGGPRICVRQDRDAGDDALPGQAVPVEALLQGGHLRQAGTDPKGALGDKPPTSPTSMDTSLSPSFIFKKKLRRKKGEEEEKKRRKKMRREMNSF